MPFTELTADQIAELRGSTRQTGQYKAMIQEFVDSGVAGADVTESFPGRKASSAYQALNKVAKRDFEGVVDVIHVTRDGRETIALVRV